MGKYKFSWYEHFNPTFMKGSASESKPLQRRNSRLSQAERTAEPFQIQVAVLDWFRRWTFRVLNQGIRFGSETFRVFNLVQFFREEELKNTSKKTSKQIKILGPVHAWRNIREFWKQRFLYDSMKTGSDVFRPDVRERNFVIGGRKTCFENVFHPH